MISFFIKGAVLLLIALPVHTMAMGPHTTTSLTCSTTNALNVVINEVQANNNFLEFYVNSESDINNWSVHVDASSAATLGNGNCSINGTATLDNQSTAATNTTWPAGTYITCNFNMNPSNNEVLLQDASGDVIDYLSYGTPNPRAVWDVPNACGTLFPEHDASNKDITRQPDGSGSWGDNGNNSTEGGTNSGGGSPPAVDHYALSYPLGNPGITCEANAVTITAHDSSDAAMTPASGTEITLSTDLATNGWTLRSGSGTFTAPNKYTFDGTQNFVQFWLRRTTATTSPHIDIDVTDGTATDSNALEDDNAEFADAALRFFDGTSNNPESINHQIGGKPSNIVPNDQSLQLRAVKTNTLTQACENALANITTDINMAYECEDPITCTGTDLLSITAAENKTIARNNTGSALNYTAVSMTFDNNGIAPFLFSYNDTGKIQLHAQTTLTGNDASDPPVSPAILIGSSNSFVVRPFGFHMNNLTTAADASGVKFKKASETFTSTIAAKLWDTTQTQDSNNDGDPDNGISLSSNSTALNFGNETTSQTLSLTSTNIRPINPANPTYTGNLTGNTTLTAGGSGDNFTSGLTSDITLSWSEVGIIDIQLALSNYLAESGLNITSSMYNVGRFIPHHFDITLNTPGFVNRCNTFTYMSQPFYYNSASTPILTITAKNRDNDTTLNYDSGSSGLNGFWKLPVPTNTIATTDYSFSDGHTTTPSAMLQVTPASLSLSGEADFDGTATLNHGNDEFTYVKNNKEAPFFADVDISYTAASLKDSDDVCYDPDNTGPCDPFNFTLCYDPEGDNICNAYTPTPSGTPIELRYGRLSVDNSYGSEILPLSNIKVTTEYYKDSSFNLNSEDICTTFNVNSLSVINWPSETFSNPSFSSANFESRNNDDTTSAITLSGGLEVFKIHKSGNTAQGPGFTGNIDYTFITDEWLKFDWDNNSGTADTSPKARASFGLFNRSKRLIYTREVY